MKISCTIVALCLLPLVVLGQGAPRWVSSQWRESFFPPSTYFTGFVSEFAIPGEPEDKAKVRLENDAKRKLLESIRVSVQSDQTMVDQSVEANGALEQSYASYSSVVSTSASAEIVGLTAEAYYDRRDDMFYAFAYASKNDLKEYYKSGVSVAVQKIESAMRSARQQENSGNKGRAKKLYEAAQPLFAELEFAQALLAAVGSDEGSIQTAKALALKSELTAAMARMQSAIAVYISSTEHNFDQRVRLLETKLKAELSKRGYSFVANRQSADWLLTIDASTREGSETNGVYVSYLDAEISIIEQRTRKEIYGNTFTDLKGAGLDYKTAGRKAYDSGLKAITDEIVKSIER
ncbi:MAG: hypothetical protein LBT94_03580 [Prevotellaceae bacterium]|jgi:hypothetical protein|nr:hypothetical protein [Prevotellaceae bacterium]